MEGKNQLNQIGYLVLSKRKGDISEDEKIKRRLLLENSKIKQTQDLSVFNFVSLQPIKNSKTLKFYIFL